MTNGCTRTAPSSSRRPPSAFTPAAPAKYLRQTEVSTSSGFTARIVASYRPSVPILAVTPEAETFRQLSLVWGVVPMQVDHFPSYDAMLASPGDRVVVTAGVPFDTPGTTNLLKIEAV